MGLMPSEPPAAAGPGWPGSSLENSMRSYPWLWLKAANSWYSPGHGSIDSQSCGVGMAESSCRDWVHWLALPTKRGVQSERVPPRMGVGKGREEKGEVLSAR